jgi:signal-transduction protein with cAMP-binding, CBS, and nucleotidyltransferase domain
MEVITLQCIRHLPVIQNGALHGIVSVGDVVKQRLEEVQSEEDQLHKLYSLAVARDGPDSVS